MPAKKCIFLKKTYSLFLPNIADAPIGLLSTLGGTAVSGHTLSFRKPWAIAFKACGIGDM
jgi:hypothetical protein